MSWKVLQGDVLDKLAEIKDGTIQCCVTSPPYWGLRDYGIDGQIGLEESPDKYVAKMVQVFREVKRVLRKDGTLWLNLGDSYAGGGRAGNNPELLKNHLMFGKPKSEYSGSVMVPPSPIPPGLKAKDLVGIPWRVAFALQADGWWLRSDIIWAKPNPMPESVTDRPTKAHEYIFLLSKSERYFYDAEAIKENSITGDPRRPYTSNGAKQLDGRKVWHSGERRDGEDFSSRNKRTVWTVATQPYPEAHFATFPPKLIEPCILAGTSPKACEKCGAPWERVVERKSLNRNELPREHPEYRPSRYDHKKAGDPQCPGPGQRYSDVKTLGWQPTCSCKNEGTGRCIVLDPFAGSGTTLWVAERFGRDSIGIELNPEYCKLIEKRMSNRQQTLFEIVGRNCG